MKLIKKDPDKSIEREKKKYFPESLKPPKESGQQNSPEK
jgi:hypothetical protein